MGKSQSKLSSSELRDLADRTNFDLHKIRMWHKGFMADCPEGHITPQLFDLIFRKFFPFGEPGEFSGRLFEVFDSDGDGLIKFPEFMEVLSVTGCGGEEEKLRWAFKMYDLNEDTKVSYQDMVTVIGFMHRMVGPMVRLPADEDTAEKRVSKIFSAWHLQEDEVVDVDRFVELSKRTPAVMHAINLYNGLL